LGQWQSRVAASLTANLYRCILPVDVTQYRQGAMRCGVG
jgi:hypothetical protein